MLDWFSVGDGESVVGQKGSRISYSLGLFGMNPQYCKLELECSVLFCFLFCCCCCCFVIVVFLCFLAPWIYMYMIFASHHLTQAQQLKSLVLRSKRAVVAAALVARMERR